VIASLCAAGGKHAHHVVVATFDARTCEQITDAGVRTTAADIGLGGRSKRLEPMPMADALGITSRGEARPGIGWIGVV
jgi:hypothetical protein